MLLKNSPWAAGVHSLSAVCPWGQGGKRGREVERDRGWIEEREMYADKCGKIGWNMGAMEKRGLGV